MKQALTIAGSDSGAGAGIQADLKTFHAYGLYATTVITAVTAQNTRGVRRSFELPVDMVESQIDAIFEDFEIATVKTGMLSSAGIVEAVAAALRRWQAPNLVVDPVLLSKGGFPLLRAEAIESLKHVLFPLATLITPNVPEAEWLTGCPIRSLNEARRAVIQLAEMAGVSVLLKGGHLEVERATDLLFDGERFEAFPGEWIDTPNTHGTGCTYASAIAALLALGHPVAEAIAVAKRYITEAIRHSLNVGHGGGPLHHFYAWETAHAVESS